MDQPNLKWLSLEGISRSTIIVIVVIIIILVILLIVRAILVRRNANDASSRSTDSSSHGGVRRIKDHRREKNYAYEQGVRHHAHTAAPATQEKAPQQAPLVVNAGSPSAEAKIVQPPIVNAPVVHFQQGPVVQAQQVIQTEKLETCTAGNCGAQLEATPQLVQAQQNIHQPSKDVPAYPQRQAPVRNPRAAMHARTFPNRVQPVRQVVQQAKIAEPEPVDDEEIQDDEELEEQEAESVSQPRSNYRLVRGRSE